MESKIIQNNITPPGETAKLYNKVLYGSLPKVRGKFLGCVLQSEGNRFLIDAPFSALFQGIFKYFHPKAVQKWIHHRIC